MRCHELDRSATLIVEKTGTDTSSPAFRRWFSDSKVVDRAGKPMVMYHGTMNTFHEFYPGSHFGDIAAANARLYNMSGEPPRFRGHHGAILPVYLAIANPLRIVDDGGLSDGYDLATAAFKAGALTRQEHIWVIEPSNSVSTRNRLFGLLKREYDGLVYRNTIEGSADSWVPFEPNQIKSVFNSGAWSSTANISETTAILTLYRGEYSGNRGGNFYSPDREFARQFTQSGQDKEIKVRHIRSALIFRPSTPVYAGNPDAIDTVIANAKVAGCKAVWLDEGRGEPESVYVFDRSALMTPR